MLALRMLRQTCTIARATTASDGQGGWTPTMANVATAVPCKYDPSSHLNEVVSDRERERLEGRLYVALTTDIQRDDIVTMDDGRIIKVLNLEPPGGPSVGGAGGHVRVIVEELVPDPDTEGAP